MSNMVKRVVGLPCGGRLGLSASGWRGCCAALRSAVDSDRAAPDKRVVIGVITGVVRGDDIGQLLLRDGLLLAGVPLLEFVHHGDHTVETFGHAGPDPVLEE